MFSVNSHDGIQIGGQAYEMWNASNLNGGEKSIIFLRVNFQRNQYNIYNII